MNLPASVLTYSLGLPKLAIAPTAVPPIAMPPVAMAIPISPARHKYANARSNYQFAATAAVTKAMMTIRSWVPSRTASAHGIDR